MEFKEEMKYFKAVTYDNQSYHFAVTPKDEIYCAEFGLSEPAKKIEIKPNFVLRDESGRTIYSLDDHLRENNQKKTNDSLISEWIIPEEVFNYLIENKMITYSTTFGLLYGFDPEYASDRRYQGRLIRISKEKPEQLTKILAPLRAGKFH